MRDANSALWLVMLGYWGVGLGGAAVFAFVLPLGSNGIWLGMTPGFLFALLIVQFRLVRAYRRARLIVVDIAAAMPCRSRPKLPGRGGVDDVATRSPSCDHGYRDSGHLARAQFARGTRQDGRKGAARAIQDRTRSGRGAFVSKSLCLRSCWSSRSVGSRKYDGKLNAVVVRDFERARAAAREADAALTRGERRPLLGVPMTVKESFNVAGLPTTWGIADAKDFRPGTDALAVQRLKAAGAVILGKTNVPFVLGDWQSYNEIYGTTNNPWDLGRTPGGLVRRRAVALAAGYVRTRARIGYWRLAARARALLRRLRPQAELRLAASSRPHTTWRRAIPYEVDLAVIGPMARSAEDLALALDIIARPDEPMATAYRLALPAARHIALRDFRVLVLAEHPLVPTAADVHAALDRVAVDLTKLGAKVARSSPRLPDLALHGRIYSRLLTSVFGTDIPEPAYARLQEVARSLPASDSSLRAERVRGMVLSHRDWMRADRVRASLAQRWRDLFRDFDVVLCPVMPTTAFPQDQSEMVNRRLRVGRRRHPVPGPSHVAVHRYADRPPGYRRADRALVERPPHRHADRRTVSGGPHALTFAALVERELGGFVPPPGYDI